MTESEKLEKMMDPKCAADYGLSVDIDILLSEETGEELLNKCFLDSEYRKGLNNE
jgi:hypothetical protein